MLSNLKSFKFINGFAYYFNFIYCTLGMQFNSRFFILKLPSYFFLKKKINSYCFLFLNRFHYITFLKHIFNFYNKLFCFYYFKLKLKGLGYRVFKASKFLIKIFFNRSNFYYLHIPSSVLLKYRTRNFFFISTNYNDLKLTVLNLLYLKEFIIYRVNGIFYPRQILLVKPGKNKFR